MSEAKEKWDDVGDRFADIGKRIKEHYDAHVALGDEEKEKLNDALRQLGDSLDAGFTAIGDSLRDPAMRADLKQAGIAMADALSATFKDVAEELRKATKRAN